LSSDGFRPRRVRTLLFGATILAATAALGDMVAKLVENGWSFDLFEFPAIALLIIAALASNASRNSTETALAEAIATREELRRSEGDLRMAQELTQTGMWEVDLVAGTARWTSGMWDLLGLESGSVEPTFERFLDVVHPDDRDRVRVAVSSAIDGRHEYESEYRICLTDGSIRWLFGRGSPTYATDGTSTGMVGITLEVTHRHEADVERESLEAQLRQAQKMEAVGQLAGGIAHDFNNLLLALRGYGELALRAIARGDDPTDEVQEMLAASERAKALTSQLLAFSRRQLLQPQIVDLSDVVVEMDKLLTSMIGDDVELETVTCDTPALVYADPSQLEQVVANLAINARDAMPHGGRLRLEVSAADVAWQNGGMAPGAYALLTVTDTGCGMDAETSAHVFEPFFTTKKGVGTGLGLSTVHGIVTQSGGHILIYSEPEHGTAFKIYLPLASASGVKHPSKRQPAVSSGSGERILLVDDDPAVRAIVSQLLTDRGYAVSTASDGDEAGAIAETTNVDLLLTDIVMRGMSGRETADRLRVLRPGLAVLYMSGYTDDAIVRRGLLRRGTAFIQKPFSSEELARKVRETIEGNAASNDLTAVSSPG
jgi:PAS domain S-box-containing protein